MTAASPLGIALDSIANCFEGVLPSSICTCSADGTPNVTFLSIVHRIDSHSVCLSNQFFNKTRKNIFQNPFVQVVVISPSSLRQYRLDLRYERTATDGAVFARMKTRLDAVASQTGMSQIFQLHGVDIFRVLDCQPVNADAAAEGLLKADYLPLIEEFTARLAACGELESVINTSLDALWTLFGYEHSFLMVPDEEGKRLFTLGSRGFAESGIGSETWIGEGILGIGAARREVVRTTSFGRDVTYSNAVRATVRSRGEDSLLEREIALPGLPEVQSQLVVPLVAHDRLFGVLCLQSAAVGRFLSDDERAVRILSRQMAASMALLEPVESAEPGPFGHERAKQPAGASAIKYYKADDSIFIDDAYLIKGIAGRILWKLLLSYTQTGRVNFSNKEIRLDASLHLPDFKDNLEARLILLRRRLKDRCEFVNLAQAGRGHIHLEVRRQLALEEMP